MYQSTIKLEGQKVLITGVSRPLGIGAALARRFAEAGAAVAVHGFSDYDLTVGAIKSARPDGTAVLVEEFRDMGLNVVEVTSSDLKQPGNGEKAVEEAAEKLGGLNGLILNHCYSTKEEIGQWTCEDIDSALIVNVRASMMMIQAFAGLADTTEENAVTLFTSGQYLSYMADEMAYCVSKEALICLARQSAYLLGDKNIRVNCINPGPNDTGYCFGDAYEYVAKKFPSGRWGTPDDTADLLLFLHSAYGKWITGQLIASDGGVRESWK